MTPAVPVALAVASAAALVALFPTASRRTEALLPLLRQASASSGAPLGLLYGWVLVESDGKLGAVPDVKIPGEPDFERGFFQLSPSESAQIQVDHRRLSTDAAYSVDAGAKAITELYRPEVDALGVAAPGSSYYWRLVKLAHAAGAGGMRSAVASAKAVGQAGSWEALEAHARSSGQSVRGFDNVDSVYRSGAPYGFGMDSTSVGDLEILGALQGN